MTRKEFYNEILKLAPSEYDASKCEFRDHLKKTLNDYLVLLDKLDVGERPEGNDWDGIVQKNKKLIDAINNSVLNYYKGQHFKAFNFLKKKTIDLNEFTKNFNNDNFGQCYYRMRKFKNNVSPDYKDMFHIPFNMRTKVSTQRFSAPGYPCLYLGASAYICWEEMQKPHLDECYVSLFKLNSSSKTIKVFDLSLKYEDNNLFLTKKKEIDSDFTSYLLRLPLILACMVKVAKPDDSFKPEYIIPQLLMEHIIITKDLKGIVYTSVCQNNDFDFEPEKKLNFVFPAVMKYNEKWKYSKELCEMFQLTKPTSDEIERIKRSYEINEKDRDMTDLKNSYWFSTFGQLETQLKKFFLKKMENEKIK